MLRVIGGQYRGRKIEVAEGTTAPTKNRVREALFDILGPGLRGKTFLDLFAGSGAVGIEALSRGAKASFFAEIDKKALDLLRKNVKGLQNAVIFAGDYLAALSSFKAKGILFDYVFIDPPYARLEFYGKAEKEVSSMLAPGGAIIIEFEGEPPLEDMGGYRIYRYGRSTLAVHFWK